MSDEINEILDKTEKTDKKPQRKRKTTQQNTSDSSKKTTASKNNNKGTAKYQNQSKVKRTKRLSNEAKGILVIALSIFVALCVFTGGQSGVVGAVGGFFKNILMGLFGTAAYIFFAIILIAGINLFIDKKEKTNSYNPWLILTMFLIASVISALIYDDTSFESSSGFFREIAGMYEFGTDGYGGGVFGGLLCRLLCMLIGNVGAWILNLSVMLILVIMLTGVSFEKIIKRIMYSLKSNADSLRENMTSEVEADIDEEELYEKAKLRKERNSKRLQKRRLKKADFSHYEENPNPHSEKTGEHYGPVKSDYFELYFSGKDINELDTMAASASKLKAKPKSKSKKADTDKNADIIKSTSISFDPFSDEDLVRSSDSNEFNGRPDDADIESNDSDNDIEITSFEIPIDESKSQMEQVADAVRAAADLENNPQIDAVTTKVPRFSFSDIENDIFSGMNLDETDSKAEEDGFTVGIESNVNESVEFEEYQNSSNKNFHNADGILTDIPNDIENFTVPTNEDEFEPPSLVQLEERLDVQVKKARDAGVPMDRAFTAVKNNTVKEAAETANRIENDIKMSEEEIRKIDYQLPTVDILAEAVPSSKSLSSMKSELEEKANKLLETLASFKVEAKIINITHGPTVTRFELQPGLGIKVSKITGLADDIALSLAASGVRIEAPIPGKSAIGIEIPNEKPSPVPIREVIDTDKFRSFNSKTAFALGKDIGGNCVIADIAQFPHILIAGATGSGKSVCINSLIMSILFKAKPDEVKLIMIDPKMVELGVYNGIPHLLIPVVTDPKHASGALNWAVVEMKNRYNLLKDNKVRNIQGYNKLMEEKNEPDAKLPEIVIIIDELADLMMAAKNEVEDAINSLAALARAAGMYLVIATQRPSVDVITGVIKANVPSRISFAVSSQIDSRTIIDAPGAEKLLGKGDMLYCPRGSVKPMRVQGNFVSDREIEDIIGFIKSQYEASYDEEIIEHIEREREIVDSKSDEDLQSQSSSAKDEVYIKAVELVLESGQASVAMLQRKLKIGYQKAARIIDEMEENRVIGPYEGTKPRQVLITRAEFNEMMFNNLD